MIFEQCKDVLVKECGLVQRIAGLQELIRDAVENRTWTDFEEHFNDLGRMREEFALLEAERQRIFPGSFYDCAAGLPSEQRNELSEIYRNLKLETLKVQVAGEALMGYITGARATIAGFFELAFPDRGGKLYTPHGIPVSHDMRSMVLNQAF